MARQFKSTDTSSWIDRYGYSTDGAFTATTTTASPIDSVCTGSSGTTSLSATNSSFAGGQLVLIHQTTGTGAGNWELNKISSYVSGTITLAYPLQNTYATGAQVLVMPQYTTFTVPSSITFTSKAWNGSVGGIFACFASVSATITGTLTASGAGFRGFNGTGNVGVTGTQGESYAGSIAGSRSANNSGGGGGVGNANNYTGAGGGGGHATSGNNGGGSGFGTGGSTSPDAANLTTALFGSGGGAPSNDSTPLGSGGTGGGFVLLISRQISIPGTLTVVGTSGAQTSASYGQTASGGAGAGGSILLKGITVNLAGSVSASATSAISSTFTGGSGGVGRIHSDYAGILTGTTTPTLDSTQDTTLLDTGGSFIFNMI